MEQIKSVMSKYWYLVLPLALLGAWVGYQTYIAPRFASATAAK